MADPRRIQRKRTAGWRMPEGARYVGRPTKWGNPWRVVPVNDPFFAFGDAADVIGSSGSSLGRFDRLTRSPRTGAPYWATRRFESDLLAGDLPRIAVADVVRELQGRDLCCWCPLDQPCHADVLLEVANR